MGFFRPAKGEAVLVTSAQRSRQEELAARARRYSWTMAARTVCFVLAGVLPLALAWRLPFILAGIALPWIAVTVANAGPAPTRDRPVGYAPRATPVKVPAEIDGHRVIDV